ncbi:MAG: glycosyltransferase [Sphingobacteriaceae bacterium]
MPDKQIFQTETPGRWNKFKWLSRLIIIVFIGGAIVTAITISSSQYPSLPNLSEVNAKLTNREIAELKKSTQYKDFKINKKQLEDIAEKRRLNQLKHPNNEARINAAFYVNWDPQAFNSLEDHIDKLDMVVTESFFVKPGIDTVSVNLDPRLLKLAQTHKKTILAQVSNYVDGKAGGWNGEAVTRIVNNEDHRKAFIDDVLNKLHQYKLQGVNVDFEELQLDDRRNYTTFQQELYQALHAKGYLVTQDIIPDNDDYDLKELQKYNDYLFVMAYDQHSENSNAGDISNQQWVELMLDKICQVVPSEKVILALACYGYDWPENSVGTTLTYQQALSTAQENKSKISFNTNSANLHFTYTDLYKVPHTVYFTDAATNFNIIRRADDWETAGVAIWRLGSEDPRLWTFFQKDLSIDSVSKTGIDLRKFQKVGLNNQIDYAGDGEVLDLISTPNAGEIALRLDSSNYMISSQHYIKLPTKYVIRRYGYAPKKVVLTFDDGPDPNYTPRILKILKEEKVPAAFFVVGIMAEKNIPLLKEESDAGYEIGNHTFFHPDISKLSLERVSLELNATRKLIEAVTGRSTTLFRAPFNADAEPQTIEEVIPIAQSRIEDYLNIGESIDPHDWEPGVTADSIVARAIAQRENGSMILLHDAGGDTREETIKALPRIIKYFKAHGYEFTTIGDVLGKSKDELMPVVSDDATSGLMGKMNKAVILGFFYSNWFLFYLFFTAILLAMGRTILIAFLAIKQYRAAPQNKSIDITRQVPVSIIVPAYNEQVTAVDSVKSLLKTQYPFFEIIFVDDGSKDHTYPLIKAAFEGNPLVKILTKPNGGKASALNFGISHSTHDFMICVDADTQLQPDAIGYLMNCFTDEEIGAVAGTVKVGNEVNLITRWQSIEYITSQNMDRRAFDAINSITVVPGAIGAFRKSAIQKAGGFTSDTLAEDCDLTMRILKQGYIVRNCAEAIAYTEAPETINMLLKQRFRWSFGVMQSFWKNREVLFNKKYKYFGMAGMPNILLFQIILPLFSPLADLMMLINLFDDPGLMLNYYLAFILVDLVVSLIAFRMEKEDYRKLIYIIPQRFVWRQLMYYVLFKSIQKAIKGELHSWGILKRTGTMKEPVQEAVS